MHPSLWKQPSAFIPIAMSLGALTTVAVHVVLHGTAPQADEGTAAHIWQLLMAAQVPVILFFAIRWVPQFPKESARILGLQTATALAAAGPIYLLGW